MFFTATERRLLGLLVLLLSLGFLLTGLRRFGAAGFMTGPAGETPPPRMPGPSASPAPSPWSESTAEPAAGRLEVRAGVPFRDGFLDLNRADSLDLLALPGIGPTLAGRILALRRQRGGFCTLDELIDVKGIGAKRLAEMRPYLTAGGDCILQ